MKELTRSNCLALAQQTCTFCYGLGMRPGRAGVATPCNCVFRAAFRACFARFRQCATKEKYISRASLESNPGRQRKSMWGMKNEEYMADFILVARRVLDEAQYKLFKYHFLLGADWKICAKKLNIDRGAFFHEVYRIQQRLGRAYMTLEPHVLFPVDEYFGGEPKTRDVAETLSRFEDSLTNASACEDPGRATTGRVLRFPVKMAS